MPNETNGQMRRQDPNNAGGFIGNREFLSEVVTLTLSEDAQILAGGENNGKITASDLAAGNIISYTEDGGKVISLRILADN
jgi:hypothetical protein